LLGALDAFMPQGLQVSGQRCLDAGASTGGFTQVLLHHDAAEVVAADVGYGQLHWSLQTDSRVRVVDRCNVREITEQSIDGLVDLIVADLSFISLRLVLPALTGCAKPEADLVVMVKPQFEVGPERIGARGVVRDPRARIDAVTVVCDAAAALGWGAIGVTASPLPGPTGNVEYFLWLRKGAASVTGDMIAHVVEGGPA
jgi:23S rRNA (cytidine1920-2'-O)/16S rRNA (cytidine1409-2'-O)-methyltransferase